MPAGSSARVGPPRPPGIGGWFPSLAGPRRPPRPRFSLRRPSISITFVPMLAASRSPKTLRFSGSVGSDVDVEARQTLARSATGRREGVLMDHHGTGSTDDLERQNGL